MYISKLCSETLGVCHGSERLNADNIACSIDGNTIYRAIGNRLRIFGINDARDQRELCHQADIEADDEIQLIHCGTDGALLVVI